MGKRNWHGKVKGGVYTYVCDRCARRMGWEWPEGQLGTMHNGRCDRCKQIRAVSNADDWIQRGRKREWLWD